MLYFQCLRVTIFTHTLNKFIFGLFACTFDGFTSPTPRAHKRVDEVIPELDAPPPPAVWPFFLQFSRLHVPTVSRPQPPPRFACNFGGYTYRQSRAHKCVYVLLAILTVTRADSPALTNASTKSSRSRMLPPFVDRRPLPRRGHSIPTEIHTYDDV